MKNKKIDYKNERAEFACRVCLAKYRKENPKAITCAWRAFDGEYCPELSEVLEEIETEREDAKQ